VTQNVFFSKGEPVKGAPVKGAPVHGQRPMARLPVVCRARVWCEWEGRAAKTGTRGVTWTACTGVTGHADHGRGTQD